MKIIRFSCNGLFLSEKLDELLKDVGYQKVSLDGDKVTLEKGATLDLGATGKGIGCDVVSDFLKVEEVF